MSDHEADMGTWPGAGHGPRRPQARPTHGHLLPAWPHASMGPCWGMGPTGGEGGGAEGGGGEDDGMTGIFAFAVSYRGTAAQAGHNHHPVAHKSTSRPSCSSNTEGLSSVHRASRRWVMAEFDKKPRTTSIFASAAHRTRLADFAGCAA